MTENEPVSLTKELTPPEKELGFSVQDPQMVLRQRIEQEELAKFREDQMRAEIRARLNAEHAVATTPQEMPQAAAMTPQPIIVNVTNSVNTAATSEATATAVAVAAAVAAAGGRTHPPTILRLIYFLLIGWWAGFVWIGVAILLCVSVIGLPIGLMMFSRTADAFIL